MTRWLAVLSVVTAIVWSGRRPPGARVAAWSASSVDLSGPPLWAAGVMVGSAVAGVGVSPVAVLAAIVATVVWRQISLRRRTRQRCADTSAAVVEVTYALAAELRAGRTPAQALLAVTELAGPLEPALRSAYGAVLVGSDAASELATAAAAPGAERLRPVAAAWAVAASAGGRVAVVLERLSEAMDDDDELRRELDAALAGPKATMLLLAGLPVVGLLLGQSVGADPVQLLLHRPLGWGLVAAAGLLDGIGVAIMRIIVSRAQAP